MGNFIQDVLESLEDLGRLPEGGPNNLRRHLSDISVLNTLSQVVTDDVEGLDLTFL